MMDAQSCRFVLHDRDRIYSSELDSALKTVDLKVLKTPFQVPQANAVTGDWRHEPTRRSAPPACGDAKWRWR